MHPLVLLCFYPSITAFLSHHTFRGPSKQHSQQLGQFESIDHAAHPPPLPLQLINLLSNPPIKYEDGISLQNEHFLDTINDKLILLQHEPVYTLGSSTSTPTSTPTPNINSIPTIPTKRGGDITYHGPGQVTAYPILNLKSYKPDIHWYLRALEEVVILTLSSYNLFSYREDSITGVWVDGKKIAAFGVKVKKWRTLHGLAVNVNKHSVVNFDSIRPCGMDREVTSLEDCLGESVDIEEFGERLVSNFEFVFNTKIDF